MRTRKPLADTDQIYVFEELYQKLNVGQCLAVDTLEGPVMVIAGPGTGKTQVLSMRIANILRNPDLQMNPQNILCLTFTESAAAAMRKRLIRIIGPAAYYVKIHTFHSFCNEIIKDNTDKFAAIEFASDLEQIEILHEILNNLPAGSPLKPFGDPYIYRQDLIFSIKNLKLESISPEKLMHAVLRSEIFFNKSKKLIEEFLERNARSIKDTDCDLFLEELYALTHTLDGSNLLLKILNTYRDQMNKPKDFKDQLKEFYSKNSAALPKQKELVTVYTQYIEKMRARKLYDYEDMLLRVIKQFENDPELLAEYQEQFQYILVDEYQDTNGSQNKILDLLCSFHGNNPNIFVVGDDDQSIFRFQGASIENIFHFYGKYKQDAEFVILDKNYRSQSNILNIAHKSINNNSGRISNLLNADSQESRFIKKLEAAGHNLHYEDLPTVITEHANLDDEIFYIAQEIQNILQSDKTTPQEIAVLFRDNKDALPLADCFARMGIPFSMAAGDNILDDLEICQLIDLLKVINNPGSSSNLLFNILNYDFILKSPEFEEAGIAIKDVFTVSKQRHTQSSDEGHKSGFISTLLENDKFANFAGKILHYNQKSFNCTLDQLFEAVIKDFNYLGHILKSPNSTDKLNKLNSLFDEIRSQLHKHPKNKAQSLKILNLSDFLHNIDLLQENNIKIKAQDLEINTNAVQLMTAHKSKGLEFDYVFMHKCINKHWGGRTKRNKLKLPPGLLPETEAFSNNQDEEERRLFYVAITRAKKCLSIHYFIKNDRGQEQVPSLFVSELNHEISKSRDLERNRLLMSFADIDEDCFPEQDHALIESLIQNCQISITHLNNYLKCPRLFFYQNLLKVPSAKNKHASFGTAVHNALRDLFKSIKYAKHSNANLELNLLLSSFEEHLGDQSLNEQDHKDSLEFGQKILSEYFKHYRAKFAEQTELEYDFSSQGIHLDDIALTGRLDKIEINPQDKTVNVVDYKTGNPGNKASELRAGGEYHRQIVFYQLLCDLAHKAGQFQYKMVSGEIDFVQSDTEGNFVRKQFSVSKEDLDELSNDIRMVSANIRAHQFEKTDDSKLCASCSFKNICRR
jgi:DNA helicase-2/ATP-dependent DNA helicase PcrA